LSVGTSVVVLAVLVVLALMAVVVVTEVVMVVAVVVVMVVVVVVAGMVVVLSKVVVDVDVVAMLVVEDEEVKLEAVLEVVELVVVTAVVGTTEVTVGPELVETIVDAKEVADNMTSSIAMSPCQVLPLLLTSEIVSESPTKASSDIIADIHWSP